MTPHPTMPNKTLDTAHMSRAVAQACDWLADVSQIKTDRLPEDTTDSHAYAADSWKGSIRGHYLPATGQWSSLCPVWHTGQAVKALLLAGRHLEAERYLNAAREGGCYILDKQVWDPDHVDHGLILAFEDHPDKVNTSAVLECLDGLMHLAEEPEGEWIWERVIAAAEFVMNRMYMPDAGVFCDVYDPQAHTVFTSPKFRTKDNIGGRPLLDDGVFARLYEHTGDPRFLDVHVRVSERLVADQNPPGHWIDYSPCNVKMGSFHPRHTYWWALPLVDTYRHTGREEFLETAIASGRFCQKALRHDGGWFRGYYADGKSDSFGHATSGGAGAAMLWMELFKQTGDAEWLASAEKALAFCMKVQFTNPADPNLKGAVLEKVLPPDGTDRSPYSLRALASIFFVIAALRYLDL